jgi:hypothetical protein
VKVKVKKITKKKVVLKPEPKPKPEPEPEFSPIEIETVLQNEDLEDMMSLLSK